MAPPSGQIPRSHTDASLSLYPSPSLPSTLPCSSAPQQVCQLHLWPTSPLPLRPSHHHLLSVPLPGTHSPFPHGAGRMESYQYPAYSPPVLPDVILRKSQPSARSSPQTLPSLRFCSSFCGFFIFLGDPKLVLLPELGIFCSLYPKYSSSDFPQLDPDHSDLCCTVTSSGRPSLTMPAKEVPVSSLPKPPLVAIVESTFTFFIVFITV